MAFCDIEKMIEEESERLRTILSRMNRQEVARKTKLHPNTIYRFTAGAGVGLPVLQKISDLVDGARA